jgi:hypothetical protein
VGDTSLGVGCCTCQRVSNYADLPPCLHLTVFVKKLFFNYVDNTFLDTQGFAPFGQVTHGLEYLTQLLTSKDGSNAPEQGRITNEGEKYLAVAFPKLSFISNSSILPS